MAPRALLASLSLALAAGSQIPSGLLVDLKPTPHAGIDRAQPSISWIVPHLDGCNALGQTQSHFQLQLASSPDFAMLLSDSGRIASERSLAVQWPGPDLKPTTIYWCRLKTWTSEGCESDWSSATKIITGSFGSNFTVGKPVWLDGANFVFLRKDVELRSKTIVSAHVYAAAVPVGGDKRSPWPYGAEKFLGAYRLYVDGVVVGTGPGRGTRNYTEPGHPDYDTLDVTDLVTGKAKVAIAVQGFNEEANSSAKALVEMHIKYGDGSNQTIGTDSTWSAFNANKLFDAVSSSSYPLCNQGPQENTDARLSPSSDGCMTCWRQTKFAPTAEWQAAQERVAFSPPLNAKITQPIKVTTGVEPASIVEVGPGHWFFDFGSELMAGIELEWTAGNASLNLRASEELVTNTSIMFPMRTGNQFEMNWKVGPGTSSLEQHEYWVFRYAELKVTTPASSAVAAIASGDLPFKLTAWVVNYPWVDSDSSFTSSDKTLNSVWELCRNTLKVTSLDTTTDSNTRERLPYEADGYITGSSRYVFQREFAWQRHSTQNNLLNPTWPTEWRQTIPLLAQDDFMKTGETIIAEDNWEFLKSSSQGQCINASSGLVDFSHCARPFMPGQGVRDIVDWPQVARDGYRMTDVNTVVNAYAVGATRALAVLANATDRQDEAATFQQRAEALSDAMADQLFDKSSGLFVDGTGVAPGKHGGDAGNHSAWHAQVFPLFFGAGSAAQSEQLLTFLKAKRMTGSVYAAFAFLLGLYEFGDDHGAFALEMMTTCDDNSWCSMIKQGATAVMEAWTREEKPNLSWSHPWASAPATAIAQGLMGVTALAPGYRLFEVRPQPGALAWAELKMPVLSGFIEVRVDRSTSRFELTLTAPGNTQATVCLPRLGDTSMMLVVDGQQTSGYGSGDFVCLSGIGSGKHRVVRNAKEMRFV